ncbi:hypothetical protein PAXINDRAFT_11910 [Paxillus involutus ATCC 200175]|uniref:Uncharacterized protein n=1 Tax=Paxillus involutus ATCC 200175 TaxID=664439 RepID=A0A0C9U7G1_PAXIN|nr:hypothetical protein PAXINDRAFT_11910 [Paxillus involutus ATCC 200175]
MSAPPPLFRGEYENNKSPTDWLKRLILSFNSSWSDSTQISKFELNCAGGSQAEDWYLNLDPGDKVSWHDFQTVFHKRWPPPVVIRLSSAQKKECLKAIILKEEDIHRVPNPVTYTPPPPALRQVQAAQPFQTPSPNPLNQPSTIPRTGLFYGHQQPPQTPSPNRPTQNERLRAAASYSTLPHHPNTQAGHQAYNKQVSDWFNQHGADTTPNTTRPFPLKPGMSPMGSRECFKCGIVTFPGHRGDECPNPNLPIQEKHWREIVLGLVRNNWSNRTNANATPHSSGPISVRIRGNVPGLPATGKREWAAVDLGEAAAPLTKNVSPSEMVSSISRPCSPNDSLPANSDPVSMHLPELPSFSPLGAIVSLPSSPKVAPSESVTLDSQTAFSMIPSPHASSYIFSEFSSMPTSAISSAMASMLATPSVHTSDLPTNSSESHDLVLPNPSPSPVIVDDITPQVLPTNSIDAETSICFALSLFPLLNLLLTSTRWTA